MKRGSSGVTMSERPERMTLPTTESLSRVMMRVTRPTVSPGRRPVAPGYARTATVSPGSNSALLLDLHPVRTRPPRSPARLDLARKVDRAALQKQLFGERGLARVRVRDDRESPATGNFGGEVWAIIEHARSISAV